MSLFKKVGVLIFVVMLLLSGWDWLQTGQLASLISSLGSIAVLLVGHETSKKPQR